MSISARSSFALLIACSIGAHAQTPAADPLRTDWAQLRRYQAENAALPPATADRVVFMGNSITEGWAKYFPSQFPGKPYVGRGIGGQTTPQMLVRFRQDVVALKPKVVVILAGTNDIAGNTGPSTLEMIEDNIASMAELAQANGIRVVLSSLLPVFDYPWKPGLEPAPKILAINAWMKDYAARRGAVYLDYHSAMQDERHGLRKDLGDDGVHPNEAGYRVMARLAERAIAEALGLTAVRGRSNGPLLAVFAHPDDERVVGPLLSRFAREGREVHLVIATDGSKGVREHAGIPAGASLALARAKEADCAAKRLGVRQLHMLGLEDGGLASFANLARLRTEITKIIARIQPAAIITLGPEGGTGHPDHRLVGNVVTQVFQSDSLHRAGKLLYASLPTERLRTAPPSSPGVNGVAEDLLTVRVPFENQDLVAGRESFACHRTQYTPSEMDAINKTLAYVWNGVAYLRPWSGTVRDPARVFRP